MLQNRHRKQKKRKNDDEPVIDIEAKEEITFDDFEKSAVPGWRDHCHARK